MTVNMWTYSAEYLTEPIDIKGFKVEATDGEIGKVDEATYEVGTSSIVVDTGPWIFGRKVVIPAGLIESLDLENGKVRLALTKDQIKNSPEYDASIDDYRSEAYRDRVGSYYNDYLV
jgi:hypothetical protein